MPTFQVALVKKGQPFELDNTHMTPGAIQAGIVAKLHALKEQTKGIREVPEQVQEEMLGEARLHATIAESNAVLFEVLCSIDPTVRDLGMEKVLAGIGADKYRELVTALRPTQAKVDKAPLEKLP